MFGGGFKASKCKTLLRLAMARIKLLRNKRDIQVKQMRKEIANLLSTGQEPSARIRVEHIAREQNIMAAYDIIELFCELIIVRLPIIESQKVCPIDLKEAISSLIFASPRCADLPELLQIRGLFSSKYGKEFVATAAELRPDCGVNRRIIEKLSVRAPSGETKLKLLKEISEEHNVNWDPADSEADLLKQHEDLLDGPRTFFGASEVPVPDPQPSLPKSDEGASGPQKASTVSSNVPVSPAAPAAPAVHPATQHPVTRAPGSAESEEESISGEKRQFIPFVGPPPAKGVAPAKGSSSDRSEASISNPYAGERNDGLGDQERQADYNNVAAAAKAAAQNADRAVAAARAAAELAKTHPSRRDSLHRSVSRSSSSEEESEDEEPVVVTKPTVRGKQEPLRPDKSARVAKANDSDYLRKPDEFYRSSSDKSREEGFSNHQDLGLKTEASLGKNRQEEQVDSFSRWNHSGDSQNEGPSPATARFDPDPEPETFWPKEERDWTQPGLSGSEKQYDSTGFFPSRIDEYGTNYQRDSDIFQRSEPDDAFARLPKDPYTSGTKTFDKSDSASNLFNRSASGDLNMGSGDATFNQNKQGFATPKFDDEEPSYGNHSALESDYSHKTEHASYRSRFDRPRSKPSPTFTEYLLNSSFGRRNSDEGSLRRSVENDEKARSSSYDMGTAYSENVGNLPRGSSDPMSTASYKKESADPFDSQGETSPIPPKSRRTRNSSKGKGGLDGSGGSGSGLPLPPGRRLNSGSDYRESSRSPESLSPIEGDGSPVPYYSTLPKASAPPEQTAYFDAARDTSPSVGGGSHPSSRTSPVPGRKDSPIHPKQPDIDDLTARFEALKGKAKR